MNNKTLEETIQENYYLADQVIAIIETSNGAIVFYNTLQDPEGLGTAFLMKNENDGWKHLDLDFISVINNSQFTVDSRLVPPEIVKDKEQTYAIYYGVVNNPEITQIRIANKSEGLLNTKVVEKDGKRIYFSELHHPNDEKFVFQAISTDGDIIFEQGQ
jgi:hypothetical protein